MKRKARRQASRRPGDLPERDGARAVRRAPRALPAHRELVARATRRASTLTRASAVSTWAIGLAVTMLLAGCATTRVGIAVPPPEPPPEQLLEQTGKASWYGRRHHGRLTASGETYNMNALTAAHPTLPLGTRVLVTNLSNGRSVRVRINDRGPIIRGRIIDLSYGAARELGAVSDGTFLVRVRVLSTSPPRAQDADDPTPADSAPMSAGPPGPRPVPWVASELREALRAASPHPTLRQRALVFLQAPTNSRRPRKGNRAPRGAGGIIDGARRTRDRPRTGGPAKGGTAK